VLKLKLKKDKSANGGKKTPARAAQGITVKGNALRSIAILALVIILAPISAGFTYLLLLREPGVQEEQIELVANSYAVQQATNIERFMARLEERLLGAASTPAAQSAIISNSPEEVAAIENAMLAFFPEAIELRVLLLGELGTAEFSAEDHNLHNHIELDMVRKVSRGKNAPPEAYQVEDRWLTTLVTEAKHPEIPDRSAVILLTLDNKQLSKQMKSIDASVGAFKLIQTHENKSGSNTNKTIAKSSKGGIGESWSAKIPDSNWKVSFSPSEQLSSSLQIATWPLIAVLGISLLAGIAATAFIVIRFPKVLGKQLEAVIAGASRRSALELSIPELVEVAKQLRRATLRALRQTEAPAPSASEDPGDLDADLDELEGQSGDFSNPMFQSANILDEDEDESLDLDIELSSEPEHSPARSKEKGNVPDHIFRAYDIRGNSRTELTDETVSLIGKAVGSIAGEMGQDSLIIGCDGRASSPRIKATLVRALMESGRDIIDIGLVPTPLLYFATRHLECNSGIMVTGSHNPPDDNGLKIVLNQQTIAAGGIQNILDKINAGEFSEGNGRLIREDVIPAYVDEVVQDIAIAVPLKIVLDAGNGATSEIAPELFREMGCEIVPLYCEIDGAFPNHAPDTSNEENLQDLARTVMETQSDFGIAFDGDGDRLAVVTSNGKIVRTDTLMMLYAQDVVSRNPGADVVFDVKCSRSLTQLISHHGGRPVLWKTGHAFMKEKMKETGALLGGEFSGHIFFGERWYGFDDGMYAGARLAEILSTLGESLDEAIDKFPSTVNTPEIIIPVADDYKFELIEKIVKNADFSSGKVNTMDGIRVDFSDGWGLVRASNTGPALTARFEADTKEHLNLIQDEFRAQIALIDPAVELNF
jgi:phosphomannomutase / phosphoglucomutase